MIAKQLAYNKYFLMKEKCGKHVKVADVFEIILCAVCCKKK